MLSRLFSIASLVVFFILLLSGSALVPAIIKSAVVFFCLIFGFKICSSIINLISETKPQDSESAANGDSAGKI